MNVLNRSLAAFFLPFLSACSTLESPALPWVDESGYFILFGLDALAGERESGYAPGEKGDFWTWSLTPAEPRGTVVFIHGFLDHSALSGQLFEFLNRRNYRIIAYDLPGHGLSGGVRAGLEDFEEYRTSLDRVMAYWDLSFKETLFIGHSTGAAILLDRLLSGQQLGGAVLASPLIRFRHYSGAVFMTEHLFHGKGSIRVSEKPVTSNPTFNEKKRQDPLAIKRMPLNWPLAVRTWEKNLPEGERPCSTDLLLLQGERDWVVSYEENITRILDWFPRTRIRYYPGLKHHILNEAEADDVYGELALFLDTH